MTSYSDQPTRLGRYELIGHLATGGMAEIHLARDGGEIVVVKRLLPELVASRAYVAMFLDEAALVARLDHPNVCPVFEHGRDGAEYFIAMPFLDGIAATELIARPRDPDRRAQLAVAVAVIAGACAGLHYVHELGVLHRDVSPSNIFATADGEVKVLDFGVAKASGGTETEAGTIKGKTQYMAPEQLLGEPLDRRADVFALGIVAYELCTHARLFKRSSDYLVARAVLEEPIPRADEVDPSVPAALADAIAKALSRAPADRFATAAAFSSALCAALPPASRDALAAAVASGEELSAMRTRRLRLTSAVAPAAATTTTGAQRPWWLLGLLVAIAAIATAYLLARSGAPTPAAIDAPPVADAAPPIDAAPMIDAAPPPVDAHVEIVAHPAPRAPGTFSIDSAPYATIFVDDRSLGPTPILHRSLAAGRHRIRAVLADGRTRDLTVEVPAGKAAAPIVLHW